MRGSQVIDFADIMSSWMDKKASLVMPFGRKEMIGIP